MKRCLELAAKGLGFTYPNPLVGCVIVCNGKILGEGWHHTGGENHAEVNAIQNVKDKNLLRHSTLYVNLEPCSHFGKTPPCADQIIAHKIPHVVIAMADPFEKVAGSGIAKLKAAGCKVTTGILQEDAIELNKRFITYHEKKRPYIILKWAESVDGYMAPAPKERIGKKAHWISEKLSRQLVHKWRAEEDAIMVGVQTVNDDDPLLTTREWAGENPNRYVLDPNGRVATSTRMLHDNQVTNIIGKKNVLESKNTVWIPFEGKSTERILNILYSKNVQSIIVEGGQKTIQNFLNTNLWDEIRVFKSKTLLKKGLKSPELKIKPAERFKIKNDDLFLFKKL